MRQAQPACRGVQTPCWASKAGPAAATLGCPRACRCLDMQDACMHPLTAAGHVQCDRHHVFERISLGNACNRSA